MIFSIIQGPGDPLSPKHAHGGHGAAGEGLTGENYVVIQVADDKVVLERKPKPSLSRGVQDALWGGRA